MTSKYKDLESTLEIEEEVRDLKEEILNVITEKYDYHITEDTKIDTKVEKLARIIVKESRQNQEECDSNEEEDSESPEEDLEFTGEVDQFYSSDE